VKNYIGIWVDRGNAVIVSANKSESPDELEPKVKITEMASEVEKQVRKSGSSWAGNVPWAPQRSVSESKAQACHQRQHSDFYHKIVISIRKADRIFIMGPGETKYGLIEAINKDPLTRGKVAGVHTCGQLALNKIGAKVRSFFDL
jgi:hypothetical protein